MHLQTKPKHRRSIGEWCQDFWSIFDKRIRSLGHFIYNSDDRKIFGRHGARWSKLAAFYLFFYITLGGFFCLYLSIFMSFLPLNRPRYIGKDSRFTSRANPLSPGLNLRPHANFDPNDVHTFISLSSSNEGRRKRLVNDQTDIYTKNLDEFFEVHYNAAGSKKFTIKDVGDCNSNDQYGFKKDQPCILIRMNKIVDFVPEIEGNNNNQSICPSIDNIPVRCMGENLFDQEVLGSVTYYSESGSSDICGSLDVKHFPYNGKENRQDVYQAPYVWVQFTNITRHVLISVECRIFGRNIFYDKIAQRGSIRFQFYLDKK